MNVIDYFNVLESENRWKNDYGMLHFESYEMASQLHTSSAKSEQNRGKNRYVDVLPFDETRVKLKSPQDYINASHVKPPFVDIEYICSQGPMMSTSDDFWQMIWDEESTVIIMLNRIIENNRLKCHPYWPTGETDSDGDSDNVFSSHQFTITLERKEHCDFYAISDMTLMNNQTYEQRSICHLHYFDWPDFGVPESPTKFLQFLRAVRSYYQKSAGPPTIHCSAGIGRTGTLVLVDTVLYIIEQRRTLNIDIFSILLHIRQHRFGLVQTPDQLRFCFLSIMKGIEGLDFSGFTDERIEAELCYPDESSDGSVEYMDSDGDSELDSADEIVLDNGEVGEDGDDFYKGEEEDGEILDQDQIQLLDESESEDEEGCVSPSSIELLPLEGLEEAVLDEEVAKRSEEHSNELFSPETSDMDLQFEDISPVPEADQIPDDSDDTDEEISVEKSELENLLSAKEETKRVNDASENDEVSKSERESARKERKDKTSQRVSDMKDKLRLHDDSVIRNKYLWESIGKPLLFGSAAALGLSVLIYLVR